MAKRSRKARLEAPQGPPEPTPLAEAGAASGKRARAARAGGKRLVIVESPAKARTINRYLGSGYVVKASMGHVRDLPEKGMGVDLEHDFNPSYELLSGRRKVVAELKRTAKAAPEVFLATDLDREGEAIAWHLAEALDVPRQRLRRVVFNEITESAIREAFRQPGQINMHKVDAQQARRILDRIVGYQLSPLLWRKVAAGLSAGRVQTVAVRLIVERERAIGAFVPEEFWRITAVFTADLAAAGELEKQWSAFRAALSPGGQAPAQAQQLEFLARHNAFKAELVEWRGQAFNCAQAEAVGRAGLPALPAAGPSGGPGEHGHPQTAGDDHATPPRGSGPLGYGAKEVAEALGLLVERIDRRLDPGAKGPARNLASIVGRLRRAGTPGEHGHPKTTGDDHAAPPPEYRVESIQSRSSQARPQAPFTTASMQQAASVQLRFSASRTMRTAQQLYEGVELPGEGSVGLITYMRTDSTNLSAQALDQVREYVARTFGQAYLPEKANFYRSSPRAQGAHEAIRPTDVNRSPESLAGALTEEQFKLYDLIWRRFVACQMSPAQWNATDAAIVANTPAGDAVFKATGRQLVFDGYLKVAGRARAEEPVLPALQAGQPVAAVTLDATQHFTQPPPRYTEASLVKALEAEGIGRPSTYASIIQTIQDRQYVQQNERKFYATELGSKVVDKLVKHFPDIFDLRFTARMEDRLDDIEGGQAGWIKVLHDFYGPFKTDLEKAAEEMVHAKAESEPSDYRCPACDKPMVYRWSKNGRYLACTGYPDCKTTFPVDAEGRKLERVEVDTPCPKCGKKMVLRRSRFGPFLGCSDYPACKGTLPCDKDGRLLKTVKEEDIKETCPDCRAPMAVKRRGRRAFLGCSRYPDCKATASLPEGIRLAAPPREKPVEAGVKCPKCGKPMVIRNGRRGGFVACSGYPRCRHTFDISKLEEMRK